MGLISLRPVFSSDFGINGAPAKQMRHLPSAQEDWDEEGGWREREGGVGGVLTSPGKQMFLYITQRPPHDYPVSLKTRREIDDFPFGVLAFIGEMC